MHVRLLVYLVVCQSVCVSACPPMTFPPVSSLFCVLHASSIGLLLHKFVGLHDCLQLTDLYAYLSLGLSVAQHVCLSRRFSVYPHVRIHAGMYHGSVSCITCLSTCLFDRMSVSLLVSPSVGLCHFICLSVSRPLYTSISLSASLNVCLSLRLPVYLSATRVCSCLIFVCQSICLPASYSVSLSVYLSACLSICLPVSLSVCLSVNFSVCLSLLSLVPIHLCTSISSPRMFAKRKHFPEKTVYNMRH